MTLCKLTVFILIKSQFIIIIGERDIHYIWLPFFPHQSVKKKFPLLLEKKIPHSLMLQIKS